MALSQNGWPLITKANLDALWNLPRIHGRVRAGSVWVVLNWLSWRYTREVEAIVRTWSWGYAYRRIRGSLVKWSNHASGTAVDFNAPRHPLGKRNTHTAAQRAAIRRILTDARGILRWGGDYTGRPDEMHFEINLDVRPHAVDQLATRILQDALNNVPKTWKPGDSPVLPEILREDGIRGPKTIAALRAYQSATGLLIDGIDGPQTWHHLDKDRA